MNFKLGNFQISVNKEGLPFIFISIIFSILSLAVSGLSSATLISFFVFILFFMFFRDPERFPPIIDINDIIVSPSDGIVKDISIFKSNDSVFGGEEFYKITICLLPISVKVLRSPVSGVISGIFNYNPDSQAENLDRNIVIFENKNNKVLVSQITGMLFRKVVFLVKELDELAIGSRYSYFSLAVKYSSFNLMSMVEVYVQKKNNIIIQKGQTLIAGETIIAKK